LVRIWATGGSPASCRATFIAVIYTVPILLR
jgi:hypothetical protein